MHIDLLGLASFTWHAFEVHPRCRAHLKLLPSSLLSGIPLCAGFPVYPLEGIGVVGEWGCYGPSCTGLRVGASVYFPGINTQQWDCQVIR